MCCSCWTQMRGYPFSETYPFMDKPSSVFGSCFNEGSFTDLGRETSEEIAQPGSARAALSIRRFTLPAELSVGIWVLCYSCQRRQIQRGIEVTVENQTAFRLVAHVDASGQIHVLFDMTTERVLHLVVRASRACLSLVC